MLNIAARFGNQYLILKFIQALSCIGIFYLTYRMAKSIIPVLMMIIFGAYYVYIPYMMTDLLCSFLLVAAYYFLLYKRDLLIHLVFIFLATIMRPSMYMFFLPEPILVWLVFRNWRGVIVSFIFTLIFTQIMPLKNLYDQGLFIYSHSFDYNWILFKAAPNKIIYMYKSLASHLFPPHWNMFFETIGYYKRDLNYLKGSDWVLLINGIFYSIYAVFYLITSTHIIKTRDWFNIIWIGYFVGETVFTWTMGPRMRLPFEFILFIAFSNFMNERLKEIPLKNS